MSIAYCPQCTAGVEFGAPEEFLLGDTVFCSEQCADEWLAERSDGRGAKQMGIKPVGITFETLQGGIDVDWFQKMPDGRYLYHIPDTHRVVSVELLRLACAWLSVYTPPELYNELCAIIEDKL